MTSRLRTSISISLIAAGLFLAGAAGADESLSDESFRQGTTYSIAITRFLD